MDDVYRVVVLKMGSSLMVRLPSNLITALGVEGRDELRLIVEKTGLKVPAKKRVPDAWKRRNEIYVAGKSALQNVPVAVTQPGVVKPFVAASAAQEGVKERKRCSTLNCTTLAEAGKEKCVTHDEEVPSDVCVDCGVLVSQAVKDFCQKKGIPLKCMNCQKKK